MSQSIVDLSLDSALKLISQKSKNLKILEPSGVDKDGNDGSGVMMTLIERCVNGFMVTLTYEEGEEEKFICHDFEEVLELLRSKY